MPKNDYICLTSSRQCEICTFLKWIYTAALSVKNRIRCRSSYRLRKKRTRRPQGWLIRVPEFISKPDSFLSYP